VLVARLFASGELQKQGKATTSVAKIGCMEILSLCVHFLKPII
jgi:hypothetical protein